MAATYAKEKRNRHALKHERNNSSVHAFLALSLFTA